MVFNWEFLAPCYNFRMRRSWIFLIAVFLLLTGCSGFLPEPTITRPAATPTDPAPGVTATSIPARTATPVPVLSPTPLPSSTPTALPADPAASPTEPDITRPDSISVSFHPDHALFSGDQVSLEVIAFGDQDLEGQEIQLELPDGTLVEGSKFGRYGIGGRLQATLTWVWDTTGLPPGDYVLTLSMPADGVSWSETVSLLPQGDLGFPEPDARWETIESDCCVVNYITGTAAGRDIEELLASAERQAHRVEDLFAVDLQEQLQLTLLPRVMGHGGFAGSEVSISYLDRNYAGGQVDFVLGHEFIHKLDGQLGGEGRPSIFIEGLAVYLNGGHFKPEPLVARAAALLPPADGCLEIDAAAEVASSAGQAVPCALDWYIPLQQLSEDFYLSQHEIGYLQAGALVQYMVERWGLGAFQAFYRDIDPDPGALDPGNGDQNGPALAIDRALRKHFEVTFSELEAQFLDYLESEPLDASWVNDVRLTVEFYDSVRRYQQLLDPSAYFLTAWLVDGGQMRERGIVADFLRHPSSSGNIALETMLVTAGEALQAGDFQESEAVLEAASRVMDALTGGSGKPFSAHPLALDYYRVVETLLAAGYQPQKIRIDSGMAQVIVNRDAVGLIPLQLGKAGGSWEILRGAQ